MTTSGKISGKLIPAVESRLAKASIADIGSVPAIMATIQCGKAAVTCTGLIDTGADLSLVDQTVFDRLGDQAPRLHAKVLSTGFVNKHLVMYNLDIKLAGPEPGQTLDFEKVPVVVTDLHRPVLVLGRQGMLEWLRVEIDFPRGTVTLIQPHKFTAEYPSLARELPGFERVTAFMDKDGLVQGIVMLAMEMERFLDRMVASDQNLRIQVEGKLPARATLRDKLHAICSARKCELLKPQIDRFVTFRNIAAHAPGDAVLNLSAQAFLEAAERIVSRLSQERRRPNKEPEATR